MAINHNHKQLDPNAYPYFKLTHPRFFYIYVPYHNYNTYTIYKQPKPKKQLRCFSLTTTDHVPSGPRILKWLPVNNKNKNKTSNATVSDHNKLQRWKNSCKNYHQNLAFENNTTSLMIKNIPNKYTRKMLMQTLDVHCDVENKKIMNGSGNKSAYDFLYLPIDFRRRMNGGFAFVNFTNTEGAARFRDAFNGKRWNVFESSKVAQISRAKIQGKEGLINNCKDMDFSHGLKEDMPVIFAPPREGFGHQLPSKMFTVGKYLPRRKYSRTTHA